MQFQSEIENGGPSYETLCLSFIAGADMLQLYRMATVKRQLAWFVFNDAGYKNYHQKLLKQLSCFS